MRRIRNWCSALAAIAIATLVFASTTAWAANNVPTAGSNDGNTILIVKNDIDIGKTAIMTPDFGSVTAGIGLLEKKVFVLPTSVRGAIPVDYGDAIHAIDRNRSNYSNLPENPWAMAKYSANGNMPSGAKPDNPCDESRRVMRSDQAMYQYMPPTAIVRTTGPNRHPLLL